MFDVGLKEPKASIVAPLECIIYKPHLDAVPSIADRVMLPEGWLMVFVFQEWIFSIDKIISRSP